MPVKDGRFQEKYLQIEFERGVFRWDTGDQNTMSAILSIHFLFFFAFQEIVVSLFKHQQQKMQEKGGLMSELSTLHCRAQNPRDLSVKDTGLAT